LPLVLLREVPAVNVTESCADNTWLPFAWVHAREPGELVFIVAWLLLQLCVKQDMKFVNNRIAVSSFFIGSAFVWLNCLNFL